MAKVDLDKYDLSDARVSSEQEFSDLLETLFEEVSSVLMRICGIIHSVVKEDGKYLVQRGEEEYIKKYDTLEEVLSDTEFSGEVPLSSRFADISLAIFLPM